ncbi:MAG TPA: flagellar FlbD family protein [Acidimicrobiales bacterium]|nr:flagellar FlbD family protein [Acidimicrobiales bacterium]
MVILTRLNGTPVAINPDLIERADSTPDTVLTLVDGTKYLVKETMDDVVELVREFRASVVARADAIQYNAPRTRLRVVHEDGED